MEFTLHPRFLLQFLLLLPLLSSSVPYNPSVKYFMNCGSDTNVDLEEYRTFVGDENSNTSFSVGKSKSIHNENPLPGTSPLYHTARIYTKISSYMLDITQTGSYLVRLHFFPFSFKGTHLADALFNVSASNFSLLTDFRVPNSTTEFPVIKEFFLTIAAGNFEIYFQPAEETTFAFVNAIEAFLLPPNFFMDNSTIPPLQTKDGALRTLYRINVGGPEVNDTLWRNWVPDDDYLAFGGSGASRSFGGELHEASQGLIVQEIAPDSVYKTCKEARVDNITWRFNVSKKARHLVRLHFCDFISESPGTVKFDLNISTNFSHVIDPNSGGFSEMASPFFYDFVVPSDDSGYMSFSIAPGNNSTAKVAFLNGLEIMEFVGNTIVVVPVDEHETKKHLALIIGSAGDSQQREEINLAEWGMFWQKEGQLEKIMDPLLAGHINPNSLRKFGEIVEMCLKPQGTDRPNMIDVCWDLEYAMQLQQTAVHREAHEDNTATGVSSDSALPLMQNMSSNTFPMDDYSDTTDTVMYPN
ncbi:receptor-like protein kinase [Populus alba x Populus x berolinensis]|uniref:Receptor-like protein kinase n=1 Tax=Populus alba x Populus x berolinensis TaxID=444605 RepID=A0AAD6QVF9_9ROSI|nr:receptor-like protein kinase [Populus alba x Populus x berolinensis]